MGIQGLLKHLQGVQRDQHVSQYAGLTAAVDAHGWLHTGLFTNALELATGVPSKAHINFCMKRASMLKRFGVEPVLIFDGRDIPAKEQTNRDRRELRRKHHEEGERRLRDGDRQGARGCFAQALEVSHEMVATLIEELLIADIMFIVAPYEADSQMAYLSLSGVVDICVSEDSDMLAMGCSRVLYKMKASGHGKEICLTDALGGRSFEQFQAACILMGCDYLPRVHGVGPSTAFRLIDKCSQRGEHDIEVRHIVTEAVRMGLPFPDTYVQQFQNACLVFRHQTVLDPLKGCTVPLRPLPQGLKTEQRLWKLIGPPRDPLCLAPSESASDETHRASSPTRGRRAISNRVTPETPEGSVKGTPPAKRLAPREDLDHEERGHGVQSQPSPFVSTTWMPPQLCKKPLISLEEFVRRETCSAGPRTVQSYQQKSSVPAHVSRQEQRKMHYIEQSRPAHLGSEARARSRSRPKSREVQMIETPVYHTRSLQSRHRMDSETTASHHSRFFGA